MVATYTLPLNRRHFVKQYSYSWGQCSLANHVLPFRSNLGQILCWKFYAIFNQSDWLLAQKASTKPSVILRSKILCRIERQCSKSEMILKECYRLILPSLINSADGKKSDFLSIITFEGGESLSFSVCFSKCYPIVSLLGGLSSAQI